jgi:hypothetical protein
MIGVEVVLDIFRNQRFAFAVRWAVFMEINFSVAGDDVGRNGFETFGTNARCGFEEGIGARAAFNGVQGFCEELSRCRDREEEFGARRQSRKRRRIRFVNEFPFFSKGKFIPQNSISQRLHQCFFK